MSARGDARKRQQEQGAREVGLTGAEELADVSAAIRTYLRAETVCISPSFLATALTSILAPIVARIKAEAIAQEREFKEQYHEQWMLTEAELNDLRALLSSDATAALDTVREQAKAEALREAADEMWRVFLRLPPHAPSPLGDYIQRRVNALRARAAETEAGR